MVSGNNSLQNTLLLPPIQHQSYSVAAGDRQMYPNLAFAIRPEPDRRAIDSKLIIHTKNMTMRNLQASQADEDYLGDSEGTKP